MGFKQGAAHSDVMNYKPPQGPTTLHHEGPGLGGHNLGHCGTQGPEPDSRDTQGEHMESPGLHGDDHHHGTNKRHG